MTADEARAVLDAAMDDFRAGREVDAARLAEAARNDVPATAVEAWCMLARIALRAGDLPSGRRHATTALAAAAEDAALQHLPLHLAAAIARLDGDLEAARGLYRRSIALNGSLGIAGAVAAEQRNLAYVEWHRGDAASAAALLGLTDPSTAPERSMDLALAALLEGAREDAERFLREARSAFAAQGRVPDPDDEQELAHLERAIRGRQ